MVLDVMKASGGSLGQRYRAAEATAQEVADRNWTCTPLRRILDAQEAAEIAEGRSFRTPYKAPGAFSSAPR